MTMFKKDGKMSNELNREEVFYQSDQNRIHSRAEDSNKC